MADQYQKKELVEIVNILRKNKIKTTPWLFGIEAVAEIIKIVRQKDKDDFVRLLRKKIPEESTYYGAVWAVTEIIKHIYEGKEEEVSK